jgi:hypothetical protein
MKKVLSVILCSLLFTVISFAETAVVKRNVTLRPGPSTDNEALITLRPGQRMTLVSLRKNNGYLQVTVGQQRGWVWAHNVDIDESSVDEAEEHDTSATQPAHDEHESRFELTEAFIRNEWRHPIRALGVIPEGTGPVHGPVDDCEVHIGSRLRDESISDFPKLVLEPPSVCKDNSKSKASWRRFYEGATDKNCTAVGFIRAWPEHLDNGTGASNPPHFMEMHPLRQLDCDSGPKIDLRSRLKAFPDMGYKDAALVDVIFRTFRLWVKRVPNPDSDALTTIQFDYSVCDRDEHRCGNHTSVPNFARLSVRVLPNTLRMAGGNDSEEQFKSVIVRAQPHLEEEGEAVRSHLTKLYALTGTDFFQTLTTGGPTLTSEQDVLGIFTIDPLAVIKTLDKMKQSGTEEWTEVSFPVAIIVFGLVQE